MRVRITPVGTKRDSFRDLLTCLATIRNAKSKKEAAGLEFRALEIVEIGIVVDYIVLYTFLQKYEIPQK